MTACATSGVFLAAVLAACAPAADPISPRDVAAIEAASRTWVETYNRNDWEALSELFTPDAVMMPPGVPAVQGRSAIAAWEATNEAGFRIAFAIDEIDGSGDTGFVRGRSCVFIPTASGAYEVDVGKFLEIRKRQADGNWLIHADVFNSDTAAGEDLAPICPFAPPPA